MHRPALLGGPELSGETTLPGVKPARSRRAQGRAFGLPLLAAAATLLGVGIGLYIVRQPVPVPAASQAMPPSVSNPSSAPAPSKPAMPPPSGPAPAVPSTPSPEPTASVPAVQPPSDPAPAPTPASKLDLTSDLSPQEMLAPLKPPTPPLAAAIKAADRSQSTTRTERPANVEARAKPEASSERPNEPLPTAPAPVVQAPFQLVVDGPQGPMTRPLSGSGSVRLGEVEGMAIALSYSSSAEGLKATLECQPWAIVAVNGISVGKTPVALDLKDAAVKVELRRPGAAPVILRLAAPRQP
ncbi:MAG: hypothetical protein HY901_23490 [Deltaproteobacteria bacterium]|nr:hypothetical protein [Deltaproteobacteria bacterium]